MQMAKRNKAQRNLKRTGRLTPYDARVAGTFAERPAPPKAAPRALTAAEVRADNTAAVRLAAAAGDLRRWLPLFAADLATLNRGKRGRPYEFSDLLVVWVMTVKTLFDGTFRNIAGFTGDLLEAVGVTGISYSRLQERGTALAAGAAVPAAAAELRGRYGEHILAVCADPHPADRVRRVGIDSTGLSLSCPNHWRLEKWQTGPQDRGWLKLHALCDADTGEIIACALTDSTVGDPALLKVLVAAAAAAGHRFDTVYADGAYATDANWIYLCREHRYRFVTSFRVDTVSASNGCLARGAAAARWCALPYAEWVLASGYGTRWKCECTFSDLKRLFPETLTARSRAGLICQVLSRVRVFNTYKRIRAGIMRVTGNGIAVA